MSLLKEEDYGWTFGNQFSQLGGDPGFSISMTQSTWSLSETQLTMMSSKHKDKFMIRSLLLFALPCLVMIPGS
ncbi:hypothetical protein DUI87_22846 [Hirundo rustica rustica]|uniref:Uncharacterized protein n=1 Tax=Hirundo rustica rustica TaxID=333673 RepID=A0A3M0JIT8_HIRRU|nr:hypothetical protein DUI87_22846 [Hirundo rustica rustica]